MFQPLEVETRVASGSAIAHIPVRAVGSYVRADGIRCLGPAQMSIIPAKVAGVETVVACTAAPEGGRLRSRHDQCDEVRRRRPHLLSSAASPRWP